MMSGHHGPNIEIRNGHQTFTNQESSFYSKAYIERANNIDYARLHGTLVHKARRNPILGEKSARQGFNDWDFRVPAGAEPVERWEIPYEPSPLIAKFETQKKKFADDEAKKQSFINNTYMNYKNGSTSAVENSKQDSIRSGRPNEDSQNLTGRSSNLMATATTGRLDNVVSGRYSNNEYSNANTSRSIMSTNRSQSLPYLPPETVRSTVEVAVKPPKPHQLLQASSSSMKLLSQDHPEIVEKWRAERAAQFIKNKMDKKSKTTSSTYYDSRNQTLPSSRLRNQLDTITEELEKTNKMIAKQEKKLASKSNRDIANKDMYITETARKYLEKT